MQNRFTAKFDSFVCEGDTITAHVEGFDIIAKLERDDCSDKPDERQDGFWPSRLPDNAGWVEPEKYEAELARANLVMDAWKNDEWWYGGIVVSVEYEGVTLNDHAASLWGIECNYPKNPNAASAVDDYPNNYLTEVANDLLDEALEAGKEKLSAMRIPAHDEKPDKRQVIIEVLGGVAYVAQCPADIEVIIKDYDDQQSEESYIAQSVKGA